MTFDYKKHFPFAIPRQEQETSIQATLDAFLTKNKRYVILELGTGVGKSGIAITIARYINELRKGDEQFLPGAYVLTTQKVLQEQYLKDFGEP
jgi:Rad3-related DNA helicase